MQTSTKPCTLGFGARPPKARGWRGLAIASLLFGALVISAPAPAADADAAGEYIRAAGERFVELAKAAPDDADARTALVRNFLTEHAALNVIARFTAARTWREMDQDQRVRYRDAIHSLAARFFAGRVTEVANTEFEVIRSIDAGRKGFLVITRIQAENGQPTEVEWRVADVDGELRIADFVVEGISVLVNYRDEVRSLLEQNSGDIEAVIAHLNSQAGL